MEVRRLDGTRSSDAWNSVPGNFDKLNTFALYPSNNTWGIPDLPVADFVPSKLLAYSDKGATAHHDPSAAVHFFLDDYRFETMWTKPQRGLSRVMRVGAALTPDFSLWRDMPLALQLFQVYRARWVGLWMHQHGIRVIPTVGWSTPESYEFCFTGIPAGSVVAISTVGVRGVEATALFRAGLQEMRWRLQPSTILVYGRSLGEDQLGWNVDFRYYPTRWGTGAVATGAM